MQKTYQDELDKIPEFKNQIIYQLKLYNQDLLQNFDLKNILRDIFLYILELEKKVNLLEDK